MCPSIHLSIPSQAVSILCLKFLLQFYCDSFETLQVFRSWSEDVHIVWATSSDYFLLLILQNNFSHFCGPSEKILGILCMHLLQFMSIPLKLYRCLGHGLKMCICLHKILISWVFFHKMNFYRSPAFSKMIFHIIVSLVLNFFTK